MRKLVLWQRRCVGNANNSLQADPGQHEQKEAANDVGWNHLPGKKPDFDNIGKICCDALNGIAFHDDAQIVDGRVIKLYAEQPRIEVEIWRLGQNG